MFSRLLIHGSQQPGCIRRGKRLGPYRCSFEYGRLICGPPVDSLPVARQIAGIRFPTAVPIDRLTAVIMRLFGSLVAGVMAAGCSPEVGCTKIRR
jgi:hypothetical protein